MSIEIFDYGRSPEHWFIALDIASQNISLWSPKANARDLFCWLEAHEFDIAFIESPELTIVRRAHLKSSNAEMTVADFAQAIPSTNLWDETSSLDDTLQALRHTPWLATTSTNGSKLSGILTHEDIAKPPASAYFLAHLINLERSLRRLLSSYSNSPLPDEPAPSSNKPNQNSSVAYLSNLIREVRKENALIEELGYPSKIAFDRVANWAIRERNNLAHSRRIGYQTSKPLDSLARFFDTQDLMKRILALVDDRTQIWQAFSATQIGNPASSTSYTGSGATQLPFSGNNYVITAANPFEQVLTSAKNQLRNQMLREVIQRRTDKIIDVTGHSPCGKWEEASFLVNDINEQELLKLASHYGQRAIFKLTQKEKFVLSIDGKVKASVMRCQ